MAVSWTNLQFVCFWAASAFPTFAVHKLALWQTTDTKDTTTI